VLDIFITEDISTSYLKAFLFNSRNHLEITGWSKKEISFILQGTLDKSTLLEIRKLSS
jgi:hypothetical protein